MREVVDYFYGVDPSRRNRDMRWVLSSATVRAIAAAAGVPLDEDKPVPDGSMLMGCPIRIDESAEGLTHELTEDWAVWVSKQR